MYKTPYQVSETNFFQLVSLPESEVGGRTKENETVQGSFSSLSAFWY